MVIIFLWYLNLLWLTMQGIYVTTDLGNNWIDITANISSIAANHIRKILIDGEYIYVRTSLGNVYKRKLSDVVTALDELSESVPTRFSLGQNYPNPFNPSTTISFSIPNSEFVSLKVYDVLGKEVTTLVNGHKTAGIYSVQFTTDNLSSGIYFYTFKAGNFSETKKMILMK